MPRCTFVELLYIKKWGNGIGLVSLCFSEAHILCMPFVHLEALCFPLQPESKQEWSRGESRGRMWSFLDIRYQLSSRSPLSNGYEKQISWFYLPHPPPPKPKRYNSNSSSIVDIVLHAVFRLFSPSPSQTAV